MLEVPANRCTLGMQRHFDDGIVDDEGCFCLDGVFEGRNEMTMKSRSGKRNEKKMIRIVLQPKTGRRCNAGITWVGMLSEPAR